MAKRRRFIPFKYFLLFLLVAGIFLYLRYPADFKTVFVSLKEATSRKDQNIFTAPVTIKTKINYGDEVDKLAKEFDLPAAYLKSLITLECSGRKNPPSRFEKHVYARLKRLQNGEMKNMERLNPSMLKDMEDGGLKNLASSWGPFQLMGYKCVQLGIYVQDIRGDQSLYWGVKWINEEYGHLLRAGRFDDAFHFHNTGRTYPKVGKSKTFDPDYVKKGLEYMAYFSEAETTN